MRSFLLKAELLKTLEQVNRNGNKEKLQKNPAGVLFGLCDTGYMCKFCALLFLTFHENYNISFGELALISTCFFFTQLVVDFICAGIVDKLGYRVCIIAAEVTSGIGLAGLAFLPDLLPSPFLGICYLCYNICNWKRVDRGAWKSDY